MTKDEMMPKYAAGERKCPICSDTLPAHRTWPGAKYRFCGKSDCAAVVRAIQAGQYIEINELKCDADGCSNFVQAGRYKRTKNLYCSADCWYSRFARREVLLTCGCGCGEEIRRGWYSKPARGLNFVSLEHYSLYACDKYVTESCGPFREIAEKYFEGFGTLHYRNTRQVRAALCPFFKFLTEKGHSCLDDVNPNTVTEFLAWSKQSGHKSAEHSVSFISTFFKCMLAEGRIQQGNPVVGLLHHPPQRRLVPRPLEASELDFTWELLRERGNARLRLATAIAEEAGLRIGEISRLRVADVDLVSQRIFVGLPNKTNCERWAFFSEKTRRYFVEWMTERNSTCDHDYLLYNSHGNKYSANCLRDDFLRILCKTYRGKTIHETGFDKWSTHRLRHTMASNLVSAGADAATVMAAGGWKCHDSMAGYARVDPEVARRGYDEAMKRANEQKQFAPSKRSLTPAELLERRQVNSVKTQALEELQRCV